MVARRALIVALALLSLVPAAAQAKKGSTVYVPPGKSGATQYFEIVPASGGATAPPVSPATASSHNLNGLGQGRRGGRTLTKLAKAGAAAAALARATAPHRELGSAPPAGARASRANLGTGSALSAIANVVTGSDQGGIGVFMPLLLALSLAGAVGFALGRRFRPSP